MRKRGEKIFFIKLVASYYLTILFSIFSLVLFTSPVSAFPKEDKDNSYEDFFTNSLQEASEIASRTKLNINEMPAIVSILHQNELLKFGVDTVYEAVTLVPGVEPYIESSGVKPLIFRGVKEKGKVKLLVDGIPINNMYRGSIYYYLDFPIELVDRIEIIRGPGSVLYGSGAISGVINIITKSSELYSQTKIFGSAGSSDTYKGGGLFSSGTADFRLAVDGYYNESSKDIYAGPDKFGISGLTDEESEDYSLGLVAGYNNLSLTTRIKNSRQGTAFGMANYLGGSDDRDGLENKIIFTEISNQQNLSSSTSCLTKVGYRYYSQSLDAGYLPGENGDLIANYHWIEESFYTDFSLNFNFGRHDLTGGLRYERAEKEKSDFAAYFESAPDPPYLTLDQLRDLEPRDISSIYFTDYYDYSEKVALSGGLRWDNYSDFGEALSPHIALVYSQNNQLNYKLMYSRAYRAPSWVELYNSVPNISVGNDGLDKEVSDTFEAGLIFRDGLNRLLRFNVYYSRIDQLIYRDPVSREYNQQDFENVHFGAEFEFSYNLGEFTNLSAVASYVRAEDQDGQKLADLADFTGNIRLLHVFPNGLTSGTLFKYVSSRKRQAGDSRDDLSGYHIVDQTISYDFEKIQLIGSVKNVFNQSVKYPAPLATYPDDYPREGRTFTLKVSYGF